MLELSSELKNTTYVVSRHDMFHHIGNIKIARIFFFKDKNFSISRWASGLKHSCDGEAGKMGIMSPAFGYRFRKLSLVTRLPKKKIRGGLGLESNRIRKHFFYFLV